jgi:hypothetical protein
MGQFLLNLFYDLINVLGQFFLILFIIKKAFGGSLIQSCGGILLNTIGWILIESCSWLDEPGKLLFKFYLKSLNYFLNSRKFVSHWFLDYWLSILDSTCLVWLIMTIWTSVKTSTNNTSHMSMVLESFAKPNRCCLVDSTSYIWQ